MVEIQADEQGYNARAAVNRGQIIVGAEIAVESPDFGHLEPVVKAALRELGDAGVAERPEMVLADAGYWHKRQMERVASDGIQVLIPPDRGLREGVRPGWDKGRSGTGPLSQPRREYGYCPPRARRGAAAYAFLAPRRALGPCSP